VRKKTKLIKLPPLLLSSPTGEPRATDGGTNNARESPLAIAVSMRFSISFVAKEDILSGLSNTKSWTRVTELHRVSS
jgi:hypothetical protein